MCEVDIVTPLPFTPHIVISNNENLGMYIGGFPFTSLSSFKHLYPLSEEINLARQQGTEVVALLVYLMWENTGQKNPSQKKKDGYEKLKQLGNK